MLPKVKFSDGAIEVLKWVALVLMTLDHINKYLLHDTVPVLFAIGRATMPLFAVVLAFNLARPGALEGGAAKRTITRLALFGAVATVPFIALGGLIAGWWPLNVMATLAVSTGVIYLQAKGGARRRAVAVLLFVLGGGIVEFWWPGVALCVAAWHYCKTPRWSALVVWLASMSALTIINQNWWAFLAVPAILAASQVRIELPRLRRVFYAYYPAHLAAIWALARHI